MNRRSVLKSIGIGTAAVIATPTLLLQTACAKKVSTWVRALISPLEEIKPLIPSQSVLIDRVIAVAKEFDKAYQEGKFKGAVTVFTNLTGLVSQLITAAGVTAPPIVKTALALASIAIRAIAVILQEQGEANPAAVRSTMRGTSEEADALRNIRTLANPESIDQVLKAVKP